MSVCACIFFFHSSPHFSFSLLFFLLQKKVSIDCCVYVSVSVCVRVCVCVCVCACMYNVCVWYNLHIDMFYCVHTHDLMKPL